jgi:hypothetical protein
MRLQTVCFTDVLEERAVTIFRIEDCSILDVGKIYETIWRHVPVDGILHIHRCEDLRYYQCSV